jgi:hypothetical protein
MARPRGAAVALSAHRTCVDESRTRAYSSRVTDESRSLPPDIDTTIEGIPVRTCAGRRFLCIGGDSLGVALRVLHGDRALGVWLSYVFGFRERDLGFLRDCPWIPALHVQDESIDATHAVRARELEYLFVRNSDARIDLAAFPRLRRFGGEWSPGLAGLDASASIEQLTLWGYRPRSGDLRGIRIASLRSMELIESSIESVDGVAANGALSRLEFVHCPRLRSIRDVRGLRERLEFMSLRDCRHVHELDVLARCDALRALRLCRISFESLSFLRQMRHLQLLVLIGCCVKDGDLSPIVEHPSLLLVSLHRVHGRHGAEPTPSPDAVVTAIEKRAASRGLAYTHDGVDVHELKPFVVPLPPRS